MTQSAYRPDIDGLRAAAIILVLIFHAFPKFVSGGFVGVDVFFVISGYLITKVILQEIVEGRFSFALFYARRFRRLVPSLLLVLVSVLFVGFFFFSGIDFNHLGAHAFYGAIFTLNLKLAKEVAYFEGKNELKPLLHLWSLGVEEQFYIVWPFLLLVITKIKKWEAIIFVLVFLSSLILNIHNVSKNPQETFYLLPTRFWELLLGCGISWLEFHKNTYLEKLPAFLSPLGLLMILFSGFHYTSKSIFPGALAMIPVFGSGFVIAVGQKSFVNQRILSNRLMIFVGLISYPLYLWHWPLLSIPKILWPSELNTFSTLGLLALAFLLAYLSFRFVEKPVRNKFTLEKPRVAVVATLVILLLLSGVARLVQKDKIWSFTSMRHPVAWKLQRYALYTEPEIRYGKCFISPRMTDFKFDKLCYEELNSRSKNIVLLGDSYAAYLYPGIKDQFKPLGLTTSQFNITSCPPLMDDLKLFSPICGKANLSLFQDVIRARPVGVILAANWSSYEKPEAVLQELEKTVRYLHRSGIQKVVLFGPFPQWKQDLPKYLQNHFAFQDRELPTRMLENLDESIFKSNSNYQRMASDLHIPYVSVIGKLCNSEGCLVQVGPNLETDLSTHDVGHLTLSASHFFAQAIADDLRRIFTY